MKEDYYKYLKKEWNKLLKKEEKYFDKCSKNTIKLYDNAVFDKLEEKIPEKVANAIEKAFEKAFEKTFINGEQLIEKTFDKDDISFEFDVNDYRIKRKPNKKTLKVVDDYAKKKQRKNQYFVATEGVSMGVVGISLVDIPVFLGMILKGVYETALSYGYDYQSEKEKVFILRMITASLDNTDDKRKKDRLAEKVVFVQEDYDIKKEIEETAKSLTNSLLMAKFIQSFCVLGVVGGAMSLAIYNDILEYVSIKYKKRYLFSLQKENKL